MGGKSRQAIEATGATSGVREGIEPRGNPAGERPPRGWWPYAPAALFTFALVVRVVALVQLSSTPFLEVQNIDSRGYIEWATRIRAGEWLPAQHFYQSPLYAYFLAVLQTMAGASSWIPRCVQVVLGALGAVLLFRIGASCFSRRTGLIAALLFSLYGPLITEEIVLAKTSLVIFGSLLGMCLFLRAMSRGSRRTMAAAGIVLGITVIGVGQWLPPLAALVIYAAAGGEAPRRRALELASALALGAGVILAPLVGWNSYWGGGFMLSSGDAGLNLFEGNNELASGLPSRPDSLRDIPQFEEEDSRRIAEREVGHPLTPAQVSQYWTRRVIGWAVSRPDRFLNGITRKATVFWNSFEVPDSYSYRFLRAHFLPVLRICLTFALVGPLALTGLLLFGGHRPSRPVFVACLTYSLVIIGFYVRSRYRMPAIPFLLLYAAAVTDLLWSSLRARHWAQAGALALALGATGAVVNHRYCEPGTARHAEICLAGDLWDDLEWLKLAAWRQERGDLQGTRDYLQRAAAVEAKRSPGQISYWLGYVEQKLGDQAGSSDPARKAHYDRALQAYRASIAFRYRLTPSYYNMAILLRSQGEESAAVEAVEQAARREDAGAEVVLLAVRYRAEQGDCENARRWGDRYRRLQPSSNSADDLLRSCR